MAIAARGTGWVAAGLVVAGIVGGIGVSRSRAAPALPTAFELAHERILSVVGVHSADVSFGRLKRIPNPYGYGGSYVTFQTLGSGTLSLEVTGQKGARATIGAMEISGSSYGGAYEAERSGDDALAPGRKSSARLRYRTRRIPDGYGGFDVVRDFKWSSTTVLGERTRVVLDGTGSVGADYGGFTFEGKSGVAGGATKGMAGGKGSAKMRGFTVAASGGSVHGDISWAGDDTGVVTFTEPDFLAGKTGTIRRLPSGVYQVAGPKGYGVKMKFDDAGAGTCSVGLGAFRVAGGAYGGFEILYE